MTELAKLALGDGQTIRPFYNYLADAFEDIQGKTFEFNNETFNDYNEFCDHLISILQSMKQA